MAMRDVLALVFSAKEDAAALAAARQIGQLNGAVRVFLIQVDPEPGPVVDLYLMGGAWADVSARAREGFANEENKLRARLKKFSPPMAFHAAMAPPRLVGARALSEARLADIVIMTRPSPDSGRCGQARRDAFAASLLGAGRPILLAPPNWSEAPIGQRVVIAWKDSREAARALADAGPLIDAAEAISVVSVEDGSPSRSRRRNQADDVVAHLARRGLKAQARIIPRENCDEAAIVLQHCARFNADLLVMGGYGHARAREMVFGGVTRAILVSASIPVLMSN
jgi:nucleotide-binding universal stress UspA family protein